MSGRAELLICISPEPPASGPADFAEHIAYAPKRMIAIAMATRTLLSVCRRCAQAVRRAAASGERPSNHGEARTGSGIQL